MSMIIDVLYESFLIAYHDAGHEVNKIKFSLMTCFFGFRQTFAIGGLFAALDHIMAVSSKKHRDVIHDMVSFSSSYHDLFEAKISRGFPECIAFWVLNISLLLILRADARLLDKLDL